MMPLRSNIDEFRREARATATALREEMGERLQRLGEYGYQQLLEKTEDVDAVDTGAYRAEHVIEQDGRPIFEHPERPGPDAKLASQKALGAGPLIGPPDASEVAAVLATSGIELRGFTYVNRRYYAGFLEDGTAHMEPRRIYARARDATAQYAEQLIAEPMKRRELGGGGGG